MATAALSAAEQADAQRAARDAQSGGGLARSQAGQVDELDGCSLELGELREPREQRAAALLVVDSDRQLVDLVAGELSMPAEDGDCVIALADRWQ